MAVTSETVRGGATRLVGAALAMSSALAVSLGAACLGSDLLHRRLDAGLHLGPCPLAAGFDASAAPAHASHHDGFADAVAATLDEFLGIDRLRQPASVEPVRPTRRKSRLGGASALAGAAFALSCALGVSSTLGAAGFGCDLAIAAWTHARTWGLALSRQASMLPPPPRMHAITMGLPTLFRHPSIA